MNDVAIYICLDCGRSEMSPVLGSADQCSAGLRMEEHCGKEHYHDAEIFKTALSELEPLVQKARALMEGAP